ncbi:MAG: hypothetical protein AAF996_03185 [Pseudomonadota bacterium]
MPRKKPPKPPPLRASDNSASGAAARLTRAQWGPIAAIASASLVGLAFVRTLSALDPASTVTEQAKSVEPTEFIIVDTSSIPLNEDGVLPTWREYFASNFIQMEYLETSIARYNLDERKSVGMNSLLPQDTQIKVYVRQDLDLLEE